MARAFSSRQPGRVHHFAAKFNHFNGFISNCAKRKERSWDLGRYFTFSFAKNNEKCTLPVNLHSIPLLSYNSKLAYCFFSFTNSVRLALKMRLKWLDGNYEYCRNGFIWENPKRTRRGTELWKWKDNVPSRSFSAFLNKIGPWLRSSACNGSLYGRDLRWRCLGNDKSQFLKHRESGSEELQTIACKQKGIAVNSAW